MVLLHGDAAEKAAPRSLRNPIDEKESHVHRHAPLRCNVATVHNEIMRTSQSLPALQTNSLSPAFEESLQHALVLGPSRELFTSRSEARSQKVEAQLRLKRRQKREAEAKLDRQQRQERGAQMHDGLAQRPLSRRRSRVEAARQAAAVSQTAPAVVSQTAPLATAAETTPERVSVREEGAPSWWKMPEPFSKEADRWDKQHDVRYKRAEKMYARMGHASQDDELGFRKLVTSVSRNKLVLPRLEEKKEALAYKRVAKAAPKAKTSTFDLSKSIWAPRAQWADSKSLWETEEVEARRFASDWNALVKLGIDDFIRKNDDGLDADDAADGEAADFEVQEVQAVLWDSHDLLAQLFIHYAAAGDDIFGMALNQWSDFSDDFKLVSRKSKAMKRADFDRVFMAVNSRSEMRLKEERASPPPPGVRKKSVLDDDRHELSRVEFYFCLIMLSANKYIASGEMCDLSDALEQLLTQDIKPKAATIVGPYDDNSYREKFCYIESVDTVLRSFESSLRAMFRVLSGAGGGGKESQLLCTTEWKAFLRASGVIGADVSERDAVLCFARSRTVVADPIALKGKMHEANLPFEGFCEALCRTSILKALPYDYELQAAPEDVQDAGQYMAALKEEDAVKYEQLLLERRTAWGDDPDQPIDRCVHHLIAYIIRAIDQGGPKGGDGVLREYEVQRWCKGHPGLSQ